MRYTVFTRILGKNTDSLPTGLVKSGLIKHTSRKRLRICRKEGEILL
ncbi:hypothetical protein NIES4075_35580 [Tolypothrix sp. NIES-4075]|nr:hypothetical protein NIES4075_35580 [Tolypothrix sp. NIES-4075]